MAIAVAVPNALALSAAGRALWWDSSYTIASTIAGIQWLRIAYSNAGGIRTAAGWIAAAVFVWWISELIWFYCEMVGSAWAMFPSPASIGFVSLLPLLGIGLVSYVQRAVRHWFTLPLLCDLGVLTAALIVVVGFPITDLLNGTGVDFVTRIATIVYPIACMLLIVFSVYCLTAFGWGARRWIAILMLVGASMIVAADTIFTLAIYNPALYVGPVLDPAWALGFVFISLAASEHRRIVENAGPPPIAAIDERVRRLRFFLPAGALIAIIATVIEDAGDFNLAKGLSLLLPAALLLVTSVVATATWTRLQITDLQGRNAVAAEALRWSEARFGAVLEFSPDPMLVIDDARLIRAAGKGLESVFGVAAQRMLNQPLELLAPELASAISWSALAGLAEKHAKGMLASHRFETVVRTEAGKMFPVEGLLYPLHDGDNRIFALVLRDITERRIAEVTLRNAKESAELADRSKTAFLANMGHELRTPLNAIIGFAEIIETKAFGADDPRYSDYATDIRLSGKHLLAIVNDILDFSRIDGRDVPLKESVCDPGEIIGACLRMIRLRASDSGVAIVADIGAGQPRLFGDQLKLKQVLLNLLSNAVKFTPRGGSVAIEQSVSPGGGFAISVTDTGIGMAAEDIPVAFAPFGQVASAFTRNHDGIGLGLPLARKLMESHQGRLDVTSRLGVGTTVVMHLPPERVLFQQHPVSSLSDQP